jgi:hypothetical protein
MKPLKRTTVALIAPSIEILGGHAIQAQALAQGLQREGYGILFVPMNPGLSPQLRWLRRYPYVRTVVNEAHYLPTLFRLRRADLVHVLIEQMKRTASIRAPMTAAPTTCHAAEGDQ